MTTCKLLGGTGFETRYRMGFFAIFSRLLSLLCIRKTVEKFKERPAPMYQQHIISSQEPRNIVMIGAILLVLIVHVNTREKKHPYHGKTSKRSSFAENLK